MATVYLLVGAAQPDYVRALGDALLDAGYISRIVLDGASRAPDPGGGLVIAAERRQRDPSDAEAVTVAFIPKPDTRDHYARALAAGAAAVVISGSDPADVTRIVDAAANGFTLLPSALVRDLCEDALTARSTVRIDLGGEELEWIRSLGRGATVAFVAESWARSERDLYRCLRALYRRLNVSGRVEAIALASAAGLLEEAVTGRDPA